MNAFARIALDHAGAVVRPVAKIARVCELLDCEESQVRRLLEDGEMEGHGLGTRGVRVFLDSVAAYQERRAKEPKTKPVDKGKTRRGMTGAGLAAHRSAMAELQRKGLV